MMKKTVIYCRVSTEEESQVDALERQIKELEDFVKNDSSMILVDRYVDRGKSGTTTKNRGQYNRLYEDLLTDKFDAIIVKDSSRLTRNILDFYLFIDRLVKSGKELFFYLDNKYYTPDDMLINGIKALLASQYSSELSAKSNNMHRKNQEKGIIVTNNTMWGYSQVNGKLVIKEDEAKIVRRIFELYADGVGSRTIANTLTSEGIRNRNGGEFSYYVVLDIIANPKYKGTLVCNKMHKDFSTKQIIKNPESEWIVHENAIPAIVSKELWEAANNIRKTKHTANDYDRNIPKSGEYLFSNKIVCGKCGKYYFHKSCRKNGKQYTSWVCQTKAEKTKSVCDNKNFTEQFLVEGLQVIISEFLKNKDSYVDEIMELIKKLDSRKNDNSQLQNLIKEKDRLVKRKSTLLDNLGDGIINREEYSYKAEEINNRVKSLELEIIEEKEKSISSVQSLDRLNTIYAELKSSISDTEQISQSLIDSFLEKIVINNNGEAEVYLLGGYKTIMTSCRHPV